MKLVKEFREFIIRGNAIDLAVGIIIGAAFGAVVNSLVNDVIMPPIGAAMGGINFAEKGIQLVGTVKAGEKHPITGLVVPAEVKPVILAYGKFINAIIALVIQGFAIFLVVKMINTARARFERQKEIEAAAPPVPPAEVQLLAEIRDVLKGRAQVEGARNLEEGRSQ
ncbi:MAG: large-conductance mechanosensitive channel protein MscL [Burkholderiales bacterium]|nr:large-conductance mechanosensitive channel protein MscL [Phycisphaerae bacterium]